MAILSKEELNEDDQVETDKVSSKEAKALNIASHMLFIFIGVLIWSLLGITIGKVASTLAPTNYLKWPVYFLVYFIFLRIPFGFGNKMMQRSYKFTEFKERPLFSIVMIASFMMSICCYEIIPNILKFQMQWLA